MNLESCLHISIYGGQAKHTILLNKMCEKCACRNAHNFFYCCGNPSNYDYVGLQESESDDDILDEVDYDLEDEHEHDHDHENEHEPEVPVHPEPAVKNAPEASVAPKEAERQLSKKERKKKELAELDALLADFGVSQKDSNGQDESRGNMFFSCFKRYAVLFFLPSYLSFYVYRSNSS